MKNTIKNNLIRISSLFLLLVLMLSTFFGAFNVPQITYADTTTSLALDKTNVLEDLQGSTIDGKVFNLTDYAFTNTEETQVILFTEYCYSFYSNLQDNYALYVYVWNPQGIKYDVTSELNTINLRAGPNTSNHFNKYPLIFLNQSVEENIEGLFLKYKVNLTAEDKEYIFNNLNSLERVYRVSEIELLTDGEINSSKVTVATTYTYSGFAAGYGSDSAAENTLTSCQEQTDEILDLKVYPTQYRPTANNGKNEYTQDSLHSVYFAVPNEFIKKFGELTAVHAQWLNAVLKPSLVTGNQDIFNEIYSLLGESVSLSDLEYMLLGAYKYTAGSQASGYPDSHKYGYGYNIFESYTSGNGGFFENEYFGSNLDVLNLLFNAGEGTDSADDFIVSSEYILQEMLRMTNNLGGELVNGKYSKSLFESVDEEFTDINIKSDEVFNLSSVTIQKDFWDKLFGLDGETSKTFDGVQAIYSVKDTDITGNAVIDCNNLYISTSDYEHFKTFYETNKKDCTVFLFRYQVSDYISQEATSFKKDYDVFGAYVGIDKIDTNSYFFKQTVNLDFDVIDVTFSNGEVDTVIGVANTPIDVIPDATPPLITTSDDNSLSWWEILIAVILVVLLLIFLQVTGILPVILKVIGFIILLPFRIIAWIVNGIKSLVNKDKSQVPERKMAVKKQDYNRPKQYTTSKVNYNRPKQYLNSKQKNNRSKKRTNNKR